MRELIGFESHRATTVPIPWGMAVAELDCLFHGIALAFQATVAVGVEGAGLLFGWVHLANVDAKILVCFDALEGSYALA
jgi:hypothetical protein